MAKKIEIFSAGCPLCDTLVGVVKNIAGENSDISVLRMQDQIVAKRAGDLKIKTVPAVVIDGVLASCCAGGYDDKVLQTLLKFS